MSKILLVDDDIELVALLQEYLEREGVEVAVAYDGEQGVNAALSGDYELVVLDVMMPHMNGIEALKQIRRKSQLPVLMLTARGDDTDCIIGLELGADDYVAKPCTPRKLLARIRAILRRARMEHAENAPPLPLEVGALTLWPEQRRVEWGGAPIGLSSTEFNVLEVLARNAGKPTSKAMLSEQALGRTLARFDRSIDVHISSIRHKLGELADGRSCIQTVHRLGYQLIKE
jgi:two-component system, OmpR family, response regulator